jgi:hypothetical protein
MAVACPAAIRPPIKTLLSNMVVLVDLRIKGDSVKAARLRSSVLKGEW